jgi:hypothetical protein
MKQYQQLVYLSVSHAGCFAGGSAREIVQQE